MAGFNTSTINTTMTTSVELVVVTSFQILFGIMGLLGNSLCFVVLRRQSKQNNTNWLIVNQCVADLLTSVILIVVITHLHWFGEPPETNGLAAQLYCRIWDQRVIVFTGFAISTFNLTVISVERYLAVVHPMLYMTRFKRRTMYGLAVTAWLTAPLMQIFLAAMQFEYRDGECVFIDRGPSVGVALFIWEFFLPVVIMGFSFISIAAKLQSLNRVSTAARDQDFSTATTNGPPAPRATIDVAALSTAQPSSNDINGERSNNQPMAQVRNVRRRNITVTLFIIFVTYLVCWTPNQFVFLVFNFGVIPNYIGSSWHVFTTVLATLNICVNPIVYAFKYKAFKTGLKNIFAKCFRMEH